MFSWRPGVVFFLIVLGFVEGQQGGVSTNPTDAAVQVIDGQMFGPGYTFSLNVDED
jgi:hypothetical protein